MTQSNLALAPNWIVFLHRGLHYSESREPARIVSVTDGVKISRWRVRHPEAAASMPKLQFDILISRRRRLRALLTARQTKLTFLTSQLASEYCINHNCKGNLQIYPPSLLKRLHTLRKWSLRLWNTDLYVSCMKFYWSKFTPNRTYNRTLR